MTKKQIIKIIIWGLPLLITTIFWFARLEGKVNSNAEKIKDTKMLDKELKKSIDSLNKTVNKLDRNVLRLEIITRRQYGNKNRQKN